MINIFRERPRRLNRTVPPAGRHTWLCVTSAVLVLAATSCQQRPRPHSDPLFPPEGADRLLDGAMLNQAAAGARNDPTLYDPDFDGNQLNSLGEWKLYLITTGRSAAAPLTIYIASAVDQDLWEARRHSVQAFVAQNSAAGEQGFDIKAGAAPTSGSAESGLRGLDELREGAEAKAGATPAIPPIGTAAK